MPPSRIQLFFARDWPARICLVLFPACWVVYTIWYFGWPPHIGVAIFATIGALVGFLSAMVFVCIVLAPFYEKCAENNGAPFKIGDRVLILVGRYRGQVARVYSYWQGNCVRVDLGERQKDAFKDIFASHQLLRHDSSGPPAEPSSH